MIESKLITSSGSCTNGRIEDFRAFASIVKGDKSKNVTAWLVPGSHVVEAQIIEEGILDILTDLVCTSTRMLCLLSDE
jgi:homoaconitase/3-isopropylmalate dehydratase large subunit